MLQSQKFALTIKLQQFGLSNKKTEILVQTFIEGNIKYDQIIDRIDDISDINTYFSKNDYEDKYINSIICQMINKGISSKKIIDIDGLLEKHNYNVEKRSKMESSKACIIGLNFENLDNKLCFYDDFDIKKEIADKPTRINYSLDLLYSRIMFLKERNKYNHNKEEIYSRKCGFENKFGIKDKELLLRYPLPKEYKVPKNEKNGYTKKELTILNLMFCNMGLTSEESKDLIEKLRLKGYSYDQLIKVKDNIKELITYFKRCNYQSSSINSIISNTVCTSSASKVINIDNVLINNDYSKNERELIESNNKLVFRLKEEDLNNKIMLIKDERLPKLVFKTTRPVVQSFKLTYSRIRFIKSIGETPLKFVKLLFEDEHRFKYRFGVTSKNILEKFPVIEEKYKVKRK